MGTSRAAGCIVESLIRLLSNGWPRRATPTVVVKSRPISSNCRGGPPWPPVVAHHTDSLTLYTCPTAGLSIFSIFPDGQWISARSICGFLPRPKCKRRWFCEQNPLPPETCCTCWRPSQNNFTSAPIALRLLDVPSSSKSTHLFSCSTLFL